MVTVIINAAIAAFINKDRAYLARASADAAAYEAEKKLIGAARRRAKK
jgi:hypothetical protein